MFHRDNPSPKDFTEWRDKSRAFQELSAFTGGTFDIARVDQPEVDQPENVWGMRVTSKVVLVLLVVDLVFTPVPRRLDQGYGTRVTTASSSKS
jgi:hypothetical protein